MTYADHCPAKPTVRAPFEYGIAFALFEAWLRGGFGLLQAIEIEAEALAEASVIYRDAVVAVAGDAMSTYPRAIADMLMLGPELCLQAAAAPLQSAGLKAPLLNDV